MGTYFEMIMKNDDYEKAFSNYIVNNLIETNIHSSYCDIENNLNFLKTLKNEITVYITQDEKKKLFLNKMKQSIERDISMYERRLSIIN